MIEKQQFSVAANNAVGNMVWEKRKKMSKTWKFLWRGLGLDKAVFPQVVALVGSGGKTSLMGQLALAGKEHHLRVAVLTTTHIWNPSGEGISAKKWCFPEEGISWKKGYFSEEGKSSEPMGKGIVMAFGKDCGNGKITFPGEECYREICREADLILVEADGSRGLPVKYPGPREPVIPENVSRILCVCGLSGLGRPGQEVCQRWELVPEIVKKDQKEQITEELLARLLEEGYGKPLAERYPGAEFYYCMNQADTEEQTVAADRILRKTGRAGLVVCLRDEKNILYQAVSSGKSKEGAWKRQNELRKPRDRQYIAFIYMASGFGIRYGSNKLLESVAGKPMYRHGLETLQKAVEELSRGMTVNDKEETGAFPAAEDLKKVEKGTVTGTEAPMEVRLIVVSQYHEILESAKQMGAVPVYNPNSGEGITASIHLGIEAAEHESADSVQAEVNWCEEWSGLSVHAWQPDAYLFSVADQPWLDVESVMKLVRDFCDSEKTIACLTDGKKSGNPVIFSAKYKDALMALKGDRGGSRILRRYPGEVLQVQVKERELRDVDNPGDLAGCSSEE